MANVLLDKEVIFRDNLEGIFGKRPFEKSISEIKAAPKQDKQTPDNTPKASEENDDPTS